MRNPKIIEFKGFTFIETLLYIALTTIVLGLIFSCGWNIISAREKSTTVRETLSDARLVSERLKREIRSASDINEEQSIFGEAPGKIVLMTADGEVTIESADDKISITRGGEASSFLHRDSTRIRNFILTRQISGEGKVLYAGFSFTAEAYYPQAGNRFEYQYSIPVRSGAEIRSR